MADELEADLWVPPFPMAAAHVWESWQRIRRRKGAGPHGLAPVEWPDIEAFVRLTHTPLDAFDISLIEMLDDLLLQKMTEPASPADQQQALRDGLKAAGKPKS